MAGKKTDIGAEKYGRDELAGNAEALFGVRPETVVGALHGVRDGELTLDEARGFVNQFMKRKVK